MKAMLVRVVMRRMATSVGLVACVAAAAGAQSGAWARVSRGSIAGEVVDAETLRPLSGATVVILPAAEAPNALRTRPYSNLDLAVDWSFTVYRVRAGAFLQVRNVLLSDNAGPYAGTGWCNQCGDVFMSSTGGNRLLPILGLRARF